MAKCVACGKFLASSSAAVCSTCPYMFHKACVAIPENAVFKKEWNCPECTKKQRKGDNSSTPVKGVSDSVAMPLLLGASEDNARDDRFLTSSSHLAASVGDSDIKALRTELAEHMAEEREFRKEFRTVMANMTARMNEFENRLELLENKEITAAPLQCLKELEELQQTVHQLKSELNNRDQDALLTDLDIGHIPEEKGENTMHIVTLLATKLGITLDDRDVVFAERVGPLNLNNASDEKSGRARRIVVRLTRRSLRNDFLRAARVRRNFTTADFGFGGPPHRVYVNERLTKYNRQLFYKVREDCRKNQWRYSWTKGGRLYARQADGKPVYLIRSNADLGNIFGQDSVGKS